MEIPAAYAADAVVLNSDGVPVTTSLKLARVLGKQHRVITGIIEEILNAEDSPSRFVDYVKTKCTDHKGMVYPGYELNRNGFERVALVVSSQNIPFERFKVFFNAFDDLEQKIQNIKIQARDRDQGEGGAPAAAGQVQDEVEPTAPAEAVPESETTSNLKIEYKTRKEALANLVTLNADGILVTTSLSIADTLGMAHNNFLKRIYATGYPRGVKEEYFKRTFYESAGLKPRVMYEVTRKGIELLLTVLCAGNCHKLLAVYNKAFAKMERTLRKDPVPETKSADQAAATSEPETSSNVRINDVPKDLITLNADGEPRTTSLKLAKLMGREHKDLFFAISKLIKNDLPPDQSNLVYSLSRHAIKVLCRWLPLTDTEDPDVMHKVLRAFDEFKPEVDAPAPIEAEVMADESVDMKTTDGAEATPDPVTPDQKQIIPFDFRGHGVTVIIHDDGNPWWVAKEVSSILGFRMASDATRVLDPDEKDTHIMRTPGGPQEMSIINESGLYSLILRSRKPEAKAFKRWVTHEVLPTIRKTGGYQVPTSDSDKLVALAEGVLRLKGEVKQLTQENVVLTGEKQKVIQQRDQALNVLNKATPKLIQYATFINDAQGMYGLHDAAKIMGLPPNMFIKALRNHNYLMADNVPYQRYITQGLFRVKSRKSAAGHWSKKRTFITPKGMSRFRALIDEGTMKVQGYHTPFPKLKQAPLFGETGGLPRREIDDIFDHFFKQEGQC